MAALPDDEATIVAIATALAPAGIGVIRLSGGQARPIAEKLAKRFPAPREAAFTAIHDAHGELLDQGLVIYFPGPASFTGEDVVEFQCHGSPLLLQILVRECVNLGARAAGPGEFSQRAFLNGKIDLVQAEAIADVIAGASEAAVRGAARSLSGGFSRRVDELLEELTRIRVFVEAAIDFPEEEIDFLGESRILEQTQDLQRRIEGLLSSARRGRMLRDGLKIVIAGAPNAGKSSLLNQLAEQDSAIVTDIPGTTRDILREHIQIDGLPLHIVDTAGLRDAQEPVEREGIRRARDEMLSADRVLLVIDASVETDIEAVIARSNLPDDVPITVLLNKRDLLVHGHGADAPGASHHDTLWISARSGEGLDALRRHLQELAGLHTVDASDYTARERHLRALEATARHIGNGASQWQSHRAAELLAEDLRYAQDSLASITGRFSSDDLLGEIFSSFCIGK